MTLRGMLSRPFTKILASGNAGARDPHANALGDAKRELLSQRILRFFVAAYVVFLVVLEAFFIMPELYERRWDLYSAFFVVGIYFLACFTCSVIRFVTEDPSIRGLVLANRVCRDWSYCVSCQTPRPPRTHHCHICDACVLRRDHHCVLLAQCVGFTNWRYFFTLIVYGALGTWLATFFNLQFIFGSRFLPASWSPGFRLLCMLSPPGLFWFFGLLTIGQTVVFVSSTTCLLFALLLVCFGFYHARLMCHNQTTSDQMARFRASAADSTHRATDSQTILTTTTVNPYDVGVQANVSQFLGLNWIKSILLPFSSVSYPIDGLSFPRSDLVKFR
ncbi:unnamed protein product [Calicophoron daubneyi]|uniref:Palmitoyltransferase n=1 Tax=Calicophoron daubneyi TaxID=300641 RepID=A0AAV2T7X1_CALDB